LTSMQISKNTSRIDKKEKSNRVICSGNFERSTINFEKAK